MNGVSVSGDYVYVAAQVNGPTILRTGVSAPPRGDLNYDGILTPVNAAIALEISTGSRPCNPTTLAAAMSVATTAPRPSTLL